MPISGKKYNPYLIVCLTLALALTPFLFKNLIISSGYFIDNKAFYVAFISVVLCYEVLVFGLAVFGWFRLLSKRSSKTQVLHVFFVSFLYLLALIETYAFICWFSRNAPHIMM